MKKIIKISLISLLLLFTLGINFCGAEACDSKEDICYTPEVTFPGFEGVQKVTPALLGEYISSLYQYLLYVAGVVAVIVIMIAGFQWITAGGNQSKIGEAKERLRLTSAIIGLFLALTSYLLLYTINPNLVEIVDLSMPSIEPVNTYCPKSAFVTFSKRNSHDPIFEEDANNDNKITGEEAFCGYIYNYEVEGIQQECKGQNCDLNMTVDGFITYCTPEGCLPPEEAVCVGKEEGVSCGGNDDFIGTGWPAGYCDDEGKCMICRLPGERCGGVYGPQYSCVTPSGKCGRGTGDYCDSGRGKCSEEINGGGN